MSKQCGVVYPVWEQLGWVKWQGSPAEEKLLSISYQRCTKAAAAPTEKNGFHLDWCPEHAAEMTVKKESHGGA